VKHYREGDDQRANERRRRFRTKVGETEVGKRERESCIGGEMKISMPSNQFSIPNEKKRKKNHFPRQPVVRVLCYMSAEIISTVSSLSSDRAKPSELSNKLVYLYI
jgi:hypothetical protein